MKDSNAALTAKLQPSACSSNNPLFCGQETHSKHRAELLERLLMRQLLLAKKHGLRSDRNYYMPSNLAEAMIRLLDDSSNEGLHLLNQTLRNSEHVLGGVWTEQLSPADEEDLQAVDKVLPSLDSHFRAALASEQRQLPTKVDPTLLEGTAINFSRSLIRLAWMLQHVETLLPMAGEIQAELNSHITGVSDIHTWGLMLPSSSRVSPVTYHSVVAVRYPDLCRLMSSRWELGSFPQEESLANILWDTNAKINGLVAADLETLVSLVLSDFPYNTGFADGLFVMTTATDHKNNLNRSTLKKDYARTLRVETIANSSGGTAAVAMVAQAEHRFHRGAHKIQIAHPGILPIRHDGPHRYGTSTWHAGLWRTRPSTRSHHVGLAFLQSESGTRKQQPNGKMVQKVPQPSKPTWVSVQDVVLNSLDRPRNQVNYSQSSATFTQAQNQRVLLMSLWFLLVCHALTQNDAESPVDMFLSTSQKRSQKHMSSQKVFTSRHGLFV